MKASLGIDIGGTKIAVAAVAADGRLLARLSFPTEAERGFDRAVGNIGDAIETVCRQAGLERGAWSGIGIGCAGPVDPNRGWINNPYTLTGWDQCDIVSPLRRRFGVEIRLENDADVAVVGEAKHGAGLGADPVVMLTFGTGVGGGVLVAGRIYRGAGGEHPELGHLTVDGAGPACYCGARGCLESIASGTALAVAGRAFGWDDSRAVFAAAASGEPRAEALVRRAESAVATAAWILGHTLLPARLILGGGIMEEHFEPFAAGIRERLRHATQFSPSRLEVVRAGLGNDAGVVGAAAMMRDLSEVCGAGG